MTTLSSSGAAATAAAAHPTPDAPPSSVTPDEAHEIASRWKYDRGSELLYYYDVQTFRDIFGSEAGVLLYGYARGGVIIIRRGFQEGEEE